HVISKWVWLWWAASPDRGVVQGWRPRMPRNRGEAQRGWYGRCGSAVVVQDQPGRLGMQLVPEADGDVVEDRVPGGQFVPLVVVRGDPGEAGGLDLVADGEEEQLLEVAAVEVLGPAESFTVGLVGEDRVEAFEVCGGGDLEAVAAVHGVMQSHHSAPAAVTMRSWASLKSFVSRPIHGTVLCMAVRMSTAL